MHRSLAPRASLSFSLTLTLATALSACGSAEAKHRAPESPPIAIAIATAHVEALEQSYRASGTVRGRSTSVLTSKATGNVREVKVKAGDRIAAGQLLATLEANDMAAGVRRARAGLDEAAQSRDEASHALEAAQAAARNAKVTLDRVTKLTADGSLPAQQLDDADAQYRATTAQEAAAAARLRTARSRIEEAHAAVGEAQASLDYAKIVAPFAGRVLERKIDPGALASPGTPLLVVEEEGRLRVEASVVESRAANVALGDDASVQVDTAPAPFDGKVAEIVPSVDPSSRAFLVKVDLPDAASATLRSGMFARVSFTIGTRPRVVVPRSSVTSAGALDRVYVVENDHARLRMVTLGEPHGDVIEVLSGLADGERVVAAPTPALTDGSPVEVKP